MHTCSVAQLCPTLCDLWDSSPPEFSRQEYWSGLPFPPPGDLPDPGISCVSCIDRQVLYHGATWEAPLVAFQVFKQEPLLSELFYIQYCMHRTFLKYLVSSFEVGMYRCQNPSRGHIPGLIPAWTGPRCYPRSCHTQQSENCVFSLISKIVYDSVLSHSIITSTVC